MDIKHESTNTNTKDEVDDDDDEKEELEDASTDYNNKDTNHLNTVQLAWMPSSPPWLP